MKYLLLIEHSENYNEQLPQGLMDAMGKLIEGGFRGWPTFEGE